MILMAECHRWLRFGLSGRDVSSPSIQETVLALMTTVRNVRLPNGAHQRRAEWRGPCRTSARDVTRECVR
jgi:hypothetical protein